jgi:hypothetical protein
MLKLSKDMMCAECDERKVEVPRTNFTTRGVSSRRDVDYIHTPYSGGKVQLLSARHVVLQLIHQAWSSLSSKLFDSRLSC